MNANAKLEFLKRRLEGLAGGVPGMNSELKTVFQPVIPHALHGLRGARTGDLFPRPPGLHPDVSALLPPGAAALHHLNSQSSHPFVLPGTHGHPHPAAALLAAQNGGALPGGPHPMHGAFPLGPHPHHHPLAGSKELLNLYQLHMQGAAPFMGHRFPGMH